MKENLQIIVIQPDIAEKREYAAKAICKSRRRNAKILSPKLTIEEVKERLKNIRRGAVQGAVTLAQDLKSDLNRKYPQIKIFQASDSTDAVNYISGIADGINVISTNNSSVVSQELTPGLRDKGFNVINSYLDEFHVETKKIRDYWDLPRMEQKNIMGTFDVAMKMHGIVQDDPDGSNAKRYVAVLGANAASVEEAQVIFLQHYSNISKDLKEAQKVVIVVGIDKILKSMEDADFQCKCMGIFGMENILLGLEPNNGERQSIKEMELPQAAGMRELHVIFLDNGRSKLIGSQYEDLLLCIGCRACNKHCPIRHSFKNSDYIWTPRNYLGRFLSGESESVNVCLHCEACRIECPLEIDLPALMWEAKIDQLTAHHISFYHKLLGRPELLAKMGAFFAPIANACVRMKILRIPMEFITGIDRKTILPEFHFNTFIKWFKQHE